MQIKTTKVLAEPNEYFCSIFKTEQNETKAA